MLKGAVVVVVLGLVFPWTAEADSVPSGFYPRLELDLGAWSSTFTQTGYSQEARLVSPLGYGVELHAGVGLSRFFVQYDVLDYGPISYTTSSARSTSWFGASAGFSFPVFPLELTVGAESGSYAFVSGTGASFPSGIYKVAANITLIEGDTAIIGIRGEYRWYRIGQDESGTLPSAYSTQVGAYFAGLSIRWAPSRH